MWWPFFCCPDGGSEEGTRVKRIYSIAAMNVRVLFSDRTALFWLLAMPIVFTFVSGIVFSGGGGDGDNGDGDRSECDVAEVRVVSPTET